MPKIKLREITAMTTQIRSEDSVQQFQITLDEREISLTVTDGSSICGETDFIEVSSSLFDGLESGTELNDEAASELFTLRNSIRKGIQRLIDILKYALGNLQWEKVNVYKRDAHLYSTDGDVWKIISHMGKISAQLSIDSHPSFNFRKFPFIQEMLDFPSMLLETSLYHLHRARNEGASPKHAIIDACIAVEVGVKEFFMRLKPELTPLLEKMPSPPVDKLYGEIMEAYVGKKFPYYKGLNELAGKRNTFVHSPSTVEISTDETMRLVFMAERAVYWLHSVLDRKNIFFPNLYECRDQAIEDLKTGVLTCVRGVYFERPVEFPLPNGVDPDWLKDSGSEG